MKLFPSNLKKYVVSKDKLEKELNESLKINHLSPFTSHFEISFINKEKVKVQNKESFTKKFSELNNKLKKDGT